ncbi:hypothetical protein Asi02nite_78580 [Asanoa siamensis]|uniref:VOC domain-containing protein n=1 Tax=Asanoa siamensis TaxID=926357 RepID=A0ABQ4D4A8_9ACTN|nr:hypothetical protein Asi02nite_78580 [Asanoa siamensis]
MANGNRRPLAPVRKLFAAVLGTCALFVVLFGIGMQSLAIVALGIALIVLAVGLLLVNAIRGGERAWVSGTAHVHSVSEPPASAVFGRCELQVLIDAPGVPGRLVRMRDPRVPVAKWPDVGASLPITVAIDDPRHIRIRWDEVLTHAEAAAVRDDDIGPVDETTWIRPDNGYAAEHVETIETTTADLTDELSGLRKQERVVHETASGTKVLDGEIVGSSDDSPPLARRARPDPKRTRAERSGQAASAAGAATATVPPPEVVPEQRGATGPETARPDEVFDQDAAWAEPLFSERRVSRPAQTGGGAGEPDPSETGAETETRAGSDPVTTESVAADATPPATDAGVAAGNASDQVHAGAATETRSESDPNAADAGGTRATTDPSPADAAGARPETDAATGDGGGTEPETGAAGSGAAEARSGAVPDARGDAAPAAGFDPAEPDDGEGWRVGRGAPAVDQGDDAGPTPPGAAGTAGAARTAGAAATAAAAGAAAAAAAKPADARPDDPAASGRPEGTADSGPAEPARVGHNGTTADEDADDFADLFTAYPSARPGDTGATIHGVGLTFLVRDLPRSVAFYRDMLGFQEIDSGEHNAVLASGDTRMVLREIKDAASVSRRLVHLNLEVGDVMSVYEDLRAKGVRFTYPPRVVNRGAKLELWAAAFRDPDGHGIAITQWRARETA